MKALSRQIIAREARFLAIVIVLSVIQTWFNCTRCHSDPRAYALVTLFSMLIWIFLWRGNELITDFLNKKVSWFNHPVKRLLIGIVITVLFTIGIVWLLMQLFALVFDFRFGSAMQYTLIYSVILTLIICLFLHGREFFLNWRKVELDAVKLRNEHLTSQYESLKNQLDPHFLFNSLNVLTNLVYQDADKSAAFIRQLAEVYRYVLDTRHKELVTVSQEMKFVNAYLYLSQMRFGNKLIIDDQLHSVSGWVPPLAIQMVVENAIKHNVISEDDPLTIRLFFAEGYIVIENNLQRRLHDLGDTTGIGLQNISRRYELISEQIVAIEEDATVFRVKLPLIKKVDEHNPEQGTPDEHIDH